MQRNEVCSASELEQELNILFDNDKAQISEWLDTPIPRLDGQCPRILLVSQAKREELFLVLQEMKYGEMV
ncbi:antitoxin Xre/MbcA/ParS toxin-binding domain-containing protein [Proteus mirabilis]|jgi:uncharacterized protein (DUF2384 family)|uniref:antitoxin Xre/MbcA/ParS toxin-binding domain-containing protein n=1 Tax=Proteus mirabilis TaxID=584 RepID=UPI00235E9344|nr:antitoxin Xre/MbcA/ParS toxin-binding domain-containing protein [Proteus mirabilis]MDC9750953.1 DUF2384 domain-containing protein [Proteus mirabilis]